MAKLVVNPTSANRREIALGRTLVSIGRDPSNDLVLPDAMVSRRHAVIECRGAQYYLRDCNSSNGSVVNGDRVSEKGLRDGDLVAIGSARLLFREEVGMTQGAGKVLQHPSARQPACASCEAPYRRGEIFCRGCGARLPEPSGPPKLVCAACGSAVLLPAHFCSACGARLPEGAPGPTEAAPTEERPVSAAAQHTEPTSTSPVASPAQAPLAPAPSSPAGSGSKSGPRGALARASAEPQPAFPGQEKVAEPRPLTPSSSPSVALSAAAALAPAVSRAVPSPELALRPAPASVAEAPSPVAAPPGLRALAALLDLGLVAFAEAVLMVPVVSYWWTREVPLGGGEASYAPVLLSLIALPLAGLAGGAYYVWSWGVRGATTGQRLLDLAVVAEDGRSPIGLGRATVRLFGYFLSVLSLGIGFLLVPLTGAGLHDRIAGTRVVLRRPGAR